MKWHPSRQVCKDATDAANFCLRMVAFVTGLVALIVLVSIVAAHAHGDADWIQANPEYRDRAGIHCCGPADCRPAAPGEIARIEGGWLHVPTKTKIMDAERGTYQSIRAVPYVCVRGGELKCLFWAAGA